MIKITKLPQKKEWKNLCQRQVFDQTDLSKIVTDIFDDIKQNGDNAIKKYTEKFDKISLQNAEITKSELTECENLVSKELKNAIKLAKNNIEKFHSSQKLAVKKVETTQGVVCWQETRSIEKVGIYIPGGTAPLFSSVLMLAIPAKLAGCEQIVLCSPPNSEGKLHPAILYAAKISGVTEIFKVGGIQAVGALTFGTETIPQVDKIFGPGNQYVTAAKQIAQNQGFAIDMPAGPSEVLVIADQTAKAEFVAADLLSQAEHGTDSQAILATDNENLAFEVIKQVEIQLAVLPRKEIAKEALKNSRIIVLENVDNCLEFSNLYAPEHLILATENNELILPKIINAGSVFIGNFSCESAGDYASGTNHTLPTNGFARNYSGVSLDSFQKKITFQQLSEQGIKNIGRAIEIMAEAEQLQAHKNAVSIRLKSLKNV